MTTKIQNTFTSINNKDVPQDSPDSGRPSSFISPMFSGSYLNSMRIINNWWLWILAVVVLAALLILKVKGLAISDIQQSVFPIVILILWFSPTVRTYPRLRTFFVVACLLWLFSLGHIYGYFSNVIPGADMTIARIDGDNNGIFRNELLREIKKKRKEWNTQGSSSLIYTKFLNLTAARNWLENALQESIVLFGSENWVSLLIADKKLRLLVPDKLKFPNSSIDKNLWLEKQAQSLGVDLKKEVVVVYPRGINLPLLLSLNVEFINIPLNPLDLAVQYLSFLSEGLVATPNNYRAIDEFFLSLSRSWFISAASTYGRWQSNGPLGLAWFFVGNIDLYRGLLAEEQQGDFVCAANAYGAASAKAWAHSNPTLFAAVLNNYAVTTLLALDLAASYPKVEKALLTAMTTFNSNGTPTRGSKIALLNLMILERAGML